MSKRLLVVAALISVVAVSCGKKSPSSPSDGGGGGGTTINGSTFALTVTGGQTFTPNVIQVSLYPPVSGAPEYLALTVGSSQNAGFGIQVPTGITTYTVTSLPGAATYSENSGATSSSWQAGAGIGGSGSIVITGRTATTISGTFNVTLVATTGASSGSKTCTGSFTAKVA